MSSSAASHDQLPLFQSREAISEWALNAAPTPEMNVHSAFGNFATSPIPQAVQADSQRTIKIVVIGSARVGKSLLIESFLPPVDPILSSTLLASSSVSSVSHSDQQVKNYYKTVLQVRPGISVNAHIIDLDLTAVRDRNVHHDFFPATRGALIVYDVTCQASFDAVPDWINSYRSLCPLGMKASIMILGNKCDLKTRQISREQGQKLAIEYGCLFYECSAVNGCNVDLSFMSLFSTLYTGLPVKQNPFSLPLNSSSFHPTAIDSRHAQSLFQQIPSLIPTPNIQQSLDQQPEYPSPTATITPPISEAPLSELANQIEAMDMLDLDVSSSTTEQQPRKRPATSLPSKDSIWDKTLNLLDWLIPDFPSDNDVSDSDVDKSLQSEQTLGSSKRRRKFSNSRLIKTLPPTATRRTSSLMKNSKRKGDPSLLPFSVDFDLGVDLDFEGGQENERGFL